MGSTEALFRLDNKIAVVTGGYTGLGRDIVDAFLEYGAKVVFTSRELSRAERVAKLIDGNTYAYELDQTNYASCQALADTVVRQFGRIDILVNNAGGGSGKGECNFLKRDPAAIKAMIDSNLVGVLYCCQTAARYMAEQKSGCIINLASIAALVGRNRAMYHRAHKMEQPIEYAAAKSGILGLTRDLAAFMAPYNVRVNALSPGGFDKGELSPAFLEEYSALTPLGHMGVLHKDIKGAAVFLASEASSYVTGHNLVIDGGFSECR